MFALSLMLELSGACYTLALTRGRKKTTIALSGINAIFSWAAMLGIVYDVRMFPAAIAGIMAGTTIAISIAQKNMK